MDNLHELGLTEMNQSQMEDINGGLSVDLGLDLSGVSDLLGTVSGLLSSILGVVGGIGGGIIGG